MTTITSETFNIHTISRQPTTTTSNISQQAGNSNTLETEENINPETEARPDCCIHRVEMCCFAINPPSFSVNTPQIDVAIQNAIHAQRLSALRFAVGCNC